jgi:glycine cleavage system aminomethyltransferase T
VRALRSSAGLSRPRDVALVHVDGPGAFDLLERATTRRLHLREGQIRHTLLLRDDAEIFADVYVGSADDGFYVLAEGPDEAELVAWLEALRERVRLAAGAQLRGLSGDRVTLGIDGPYAWEVTAALLGPTVLGMPYLTVLRRGDVLCMRVGTTGEYGYVLLAPPAEAGALEARLADLGGAFELVPVGREALDVCARENGHFSVRAPRPRHDGQPLTPIELQLQWRVSYDKDFVGADALRARRAAGPSMRTTNFVAEGPVTAGQAVERDGAAVGQVLAACFSPTLDRWIGSALLSLRTAHPHVPLCVVSAAGGTRITTCTTPLVDNESLHVDPHKHSFATRGAR